MSETGGQRRSCWVVGRRRGGHGRGFTRWSKSRRGGHATTYLIIRIATLKLNGKSASFAVRLEIALAVFIFFSTGCKHPLFYRFA